MRQAVAIGVVGILVAGTGVGLAQIPVSATSEIPLLDDRVVVSFDPRPGANFPPSRVRRAASSTSGATCR